MERKEKKPTTSVPQFGGWDQNAPGATDYSMVFTQARAKKKHQKTDLTDVKRNSIGNERDLLNANHGHGRGHAHAPVHNHAHDDNVVMGKRRILTYINCCIRP